MVEDLLDALKAAPHAAATMALAAALKAAYESHPRNGWVAGFDSLERSAAERKEQEDKAAQEAAAKAEAERLAAEAAALNKADA